MRRAGEFTPARACLTGTIPALLARQPLTPAKVEFAWRMAVGAAIARVTAVEHDGTTLRVRTGDPRWSRELDLSRPLILDRLESLLGAGVVREIRIER
jgi:hypothetical protein